VNRETSPGAAPEPARRHNDNTATIPRARATLHGTVALKRETDPSTIAVDADCALADHDKYADQRSDTQENHHSFPVGESDSSDD
jgi:hypothetical protein